MTGSGRQIHNRDRYNANRAAVLRESDVCGICGHPGAATADHIVPAKLWPRDLTGRHLPGLDDVTNLQPAHGTMGPGRRVQNRCEHPDCRQPDGRGRLCNQSKNSRQLTGNPRSRDW
jgi:hypothetical protein